MWCRTEAMMMAIGVTGISVTRVIETGTESETGIAIGVGMDIAESHLSVGVLAQACSDQTHGSGCIP